MSAPTLTRRLTAQQVHQGLYSHLSFRGWAVLEEVTTADLTARDEHGQLLPAATADRRIDVLGVRNPKRPTTGGVTFGDHQLLAIEIKVSRADFASDVNDPSKQAPWRALAHQHAYAVPAGLVSPEEVPEGSGLIEVTSREVTTRGETFTKYDVEWTRRAPYSPGGLPEHFIRALAWRASSAEARLRGRTHPDRDDDPEALHAEVRRLRDELSKAEGRFEREHAVAQRWRQIATAGGYPVVCATCGGPVKPRSVRARTEDWLHVYPEHNEPCRAARLTSSPNWPAPILPSETTAEAT